MCCEELPLSVYPGIKIADDDSLEDVIAEQAGQILEGLPYRILERKGDPLKDALTGDYKVYYTNS